MASTVDDFLAAEGRISEAVKQFGPDQIGKKIRRYRERMGLSIRALAQCAHISKTSVVRLEAGLQCQPTTIIKICSGLGLHLDRLLEQGEADDSVAVHHLSEDRWYDIVKFADGPVGGFNRPLSTEERRVVATNDRLSLFLMFKSRLPNGRIFGSEIELYHAIPPRSHPGEEFIYVLAGTAQIIVGGKSHTLSQGESLSFWSEQEHIYAPAPGSNLPARLLCVQVSG